MQLSIELFGKAASRGGQKRQKWCGATQRSIEEKFRVFSYLGDVTTTLRYEKGVYIVKVYLNLYVYVQ